MESIREIALRVKSFLLFLPSDLFIVFVVILVGTAGFGLGRLSALEGVREPVTITASPENRVSQQQTAQTSSFRGIDQNIETQPGDGVVVASKNSNKYHFPWCSGAQRISEVNKITFPSIEAARAAGYLPAGNCKGLE